MDKKLLLISNSVCYGQGYLDHCADTIKKFLGKLNDVLFVPYALYDMDKYEKIAKDRFSKLGISLRSIHKVEDRVTAVQETKAIFIGGGNTFRLLTKLYQDNLVETIRDRVLSGELLYMGASAGTNISCPTIKTTNDMPIMEPPNFTALNIFPYQINPHYLDPDPNSKHKGETREQRIKEYLEENELPVLGIREGAWFNVNGDNIDLEGKTGCKFFMRGKDAFEINSPYKSIQTLLK